MGRVANIIETLGLQPHPEGGFFKETYRSQGLIPPAALDPCYDGARHYSTCIYFLLTSASFSAFHKIHQDEIWHFYEGSAVTIYMISETGSYSEVVIGRNLENGERPQFVVPGGCWFAARITGENAYCLVGCTVAPGFDFQDFTMPSRKVLLEQFPQHATIINALTRE